jgi:hypothetical protein
VDVSVGTPPTVGASVNVSSLELGSSVRFTAHPANGFPPYTLGWTGLPTGCTGGNTSVFDCTPTRVGNYSVIVELTDAIGDRTNGTIAVHVTTAAPGPGPTAQAAPVPAWAWAAIGTLIVVVVAGSVLLWRRRRAPPAVEETGAPSVDEGTPALTYEELPPEPNPELPP